MRLPCTLLVAALLPSLWAGQIENVTTLTVPIAFTVASPDHHGFPHAGAEFFAGAAVPLEPARLVLTPFNSPAPAPTTP